MKHLLNGVAIAALLAIAAPVWAQGMAPSTSAPAASMPSTTSATPPMHRHARAHHATHGTHGMAHGSAAVADSTTQLNRAELAKVQAGDFSGPTPTESAVSTRSPSRGHGRDVRRANAPN